MFIILSRICNINSNEYTRLWWVYSLRLSCYAIRPWCQHRCVLSITAYRQITHLTTCSVFIWLNFSREQPSTVFIDTWMNLWHFETETKYHRRWTHQLGTRRYVNSANTTMTVQNGQRKQNNDVSNYIFICVYVYTYACVCGCTCVFCRRIQSKHWAKMKSFANTKACLVLPRKRSKRKMVSKYNTNWPR